MQHRKPLYRKLTDKIIQAFFDVYNELGFGFLEEVGLLLNFGMKPEIRRKAFDNNRKIFGNPDNLRHLRAKKQKI